MNDADDARCRSAADAFRGSAHAIFRLYGELNHLKHLLRRGWLRRGLEPERCESIADHAFFVALLAWFVADRYRPHLDRDLLLRLALVHDLAECRIGDITPADGVPHERKHELEREAIESLFAPLERGQEYVQLWLEYDSQASAEARLVQQIDRLEMALQARAYESLHEVDPAEFFASAKVAIDDPELAALLDEVTDRD